MGCRKEGIRFIKDSKGMTLVEIVVGMIIFSIGVLALAQVMFGVMQANTKSKHLVIATNLAHQRMEQIFSSPRYDNITESNFVDEDYGQVNGADPNYKNFRRIVTINDSLNALGSSISKDVSVRVEWREKGKVRAVELRSTISRYKDMNL